MGLAGDLWRCRPWHSGKARRLRLPQSLGKLGQSRLLKTWHWRRDLCEDSLQVLADGLPLLGLRNIHARVQLNEPLQPVSELFGGHTGSRTNKPRTRRGLELVRRVVEPLSSRSRIKKPRPKSGLLGYHIGRSLSPYRPRRLLDSRLAATRKRSPMWPTLSQ